MKRIMHHGLGAIATTALAVGLAPLGSCGAPFSGGGTSEAGAGGSAGSTNRGGDGQGGHDPGGRGPGGQGIGGAGAHGGAGGDDCTTCGEWAMDCAAGVSCAFPQNWCAGTSPLKAANLGACLCLHCADHCQQLCEEGGPDTSGCSPCVANALPVHCDSQLQACLEDAEPH